MGEFLEGAERERRTESGWAVSILRPHLHVDQAKRERSLYR